MRSNSCSKVALALACLVTVSAATAAPRGTSIDFFADPPNRINFFPPQRNTINFFAQQPNRINFFAQQPNRIDFFAGQSNHIDFFAYQRKGPSTIGNPRSSTRAIQARPSTSSPRAARLAISARKP